MGIPAQGAGGRRQEAEKTKGIKRFDVREAFEDTGRQKLQLMHLTALNYLMHSKKRKRLLTNMTGVMRNHLQQSSVAEFISLRYGYHSDCFLFT